MKRSRMLLLFGTLVALLVGYVVWCTRPFYLRVDLSTLSQLPPEAHSTAVAEIENSGLREPEGINVRRLIELLSRPYDSEPPPLSVRAISHRVVFISRPGLRRDTVALVKSDRDKTWVRARITW